MDLDIKDKVDIKKEELDFSEDKEEHTTADASNQSQTNVTRGIDNNIMKVKEEPIEHVYTEEVMGLDQSEEEPNTPEIPPPLGFQENMPKTNIKTGNEIVIKEEPMEHNNIPDEEPSFCKSEEISIKEEPMEHVFVEELSFNHSEEPENHETFNSEENITKPTTFTTTKHKFIKETTDEGQSVIQFEEMENPEALLESGEKFTKLRCNSRKAIEEDLMSENKNESTRKAGNSSKTIDFASKDEQRRFQCNLCNYGTNKKSNFNVHLLVHTDSRPFKCSHCDKTFKEKYKLKKHAVVHSDLKSCKCSQCCELIMLKRKSEKQKDNLVVLQSEGKRYKCPHCNFAFKTRFKLQEHSVTHSDLKPFECSLCDSAFKRRGNLKDHMLSVHSNDKPFKCSHCKATFKLKNRLKRHQLVHSDIRPFKCLHCDLAFKEKSKLIDHLPLHSDLKPFKCPHCNSSFKQMSYLKDHLVIHSDLRPFKCFHCDTAFKRKCDLKRHVLKHSEEVLSSDICTDGGQGC